MRAPSFWPHRHSRPTRTRRRTSSRSTRRSSCSRTCASSTAPARPRATDQTIVIRDGRIAAIGDVARSRRRRRRDDHRSHRQERDPRARDDARAPVLPDGPGRVRSARRELLAPLSRRRRDDDADRRQHERLHGHQSQRRRSTPARCPVRAIDATAPYLEGPGLGLCRCTRSKDAADARRQVELLGRAGRDVVQGVHADHARRAARRRSTKRTSAA